MIRTWENVKLTDDEGDIVITAIDFMIMALQKYKNDNGYLDFSNEKVLQEATKLKERIVKEIY